MSSAPVIQTERLILRPWRDADLEPFAALNADPRVMEFFPAMLTREQSDTFVQAINKHFDEHGYGLWAGAETRAQVRAGDEGFIRPVV